MFRTSHEEGIQVFESPHSTQANLIVRAVTGGYMSDCTKPDRLLLMNSTC